jgi:GLPGLI family protein
MKKILSFIAFALTIGVQAQTKDSIDTAQFAVVYDYKIKTTDAKGNEATDSMQLATLVGTRVTKCMEYNRAMTDDFGENLNRDFQFGEWNARKYNLPVLYINYPEGETRSFDKIVPYRYLVKGTTPNIAWQLTDDTLTIGEYLCRKATGEYAGRTWHAWYTEDIPTSAGPWKLRGLPGMIFKAEDNEGIFSFTFCGLINRKVPIVYMGEENHQQISEEKFIAHRNKTFCNKRYIQNPRYYIPDGALDEAVEIWAGGPEPPAEEKQTLVARDLIVPKKANKYQPLELK